MADERVKQALAEMSHDEIGELIDSLLEPAMFGEPTPEVIAMAQDILTTLDLEREFWRVRALSERERTELGMYAGAFKRMLDPVLDDYISNNKEWRESGMRIFQENRRELRGKLPETFANDRVHLLDQVDTYLIITATQQKMWEKLHPSAKSD